jgi:hypothetical protein
MPCDRDSDTLGSESNPSFSSVSIVSLRQFFFFAETIPRNRESLYFTSLFRGRSFNAPNSRVRPASKLFSKCPQLPKYRV